MEAAKERFCFLNVVVHVSDPVAFRQRHQAAYAQKKAHPNRVEVMVAFILQGWDDPDWVERTIQYLGQAKERGALGVKVWKDIGMVFRDRENQLVMIDHPQFDPVFDFMEREGMRLMGHLGEPRNCRLSSRSSPCPSWTFQSKDCTYLVLYWTKFTTGMRGDFFLQPGRSEGSCFEATDRIGVD